MSDMFSKETVRAWPRTEAYKSLIGLLTFVFDAERGVPPVTKDAEPERPDLTSEEKQKFRRAEEAADRFIERWHQTLDLNILFDELFVADPKVKRRNVED